MAILTLTSPEFQAFPTILKEFAAYKASIENCSEKTVCEYLSDLRTMFRYQTADRNDSSTTPADLQMIDISGLTLEDIRQVNAEFIYKFLLYSGEARGNGWAAKSRKLSAIKALFRYLVTKRHLLDINPTSDIGGPKKHSSLPKFLTLDESVLLLNTVRADENSTTKERDFAMITLFLNCGMRLSELVGINTFDFDRDMRCLRVTGKGHKERMIYLNEACRNAIADYLAVRRRYLPYGKKADALFLSNRQTRISNKTVQWVVYKYLDAAGLDHRGFSVHKLRHTAATLMYQTGEVDVRVLKDILGHEQLNTTQIYTHVSDASMERAVAVNPLAVLHFKEPDTPSVKTNKKKNSDKSDPTGD